MRITVLNPCVPRTCGVFLRYNLNLVTDPLCNLRHKDNTNSTAIPQPTLPDPSKTICSITNGHRHRAVGACLGREWLGKGINWGKRRYIKKPNIKKQYAKGN